MSSDASIVSLARSARPFAIVGELDEATLKVRLAEQAETAAIPVVTVAAGAPPATVVVAVRAAMQTAQLAPFSSDAAGNEPALNP
jgi:hypothetical protein